VGEFVDEDELRLPFEQAIEIEFGELDLAMQDFSPWENWKPVEETLGFGAAVGLDDAHDHIAFLAQIDLRCAKHRIGFSHARTHAEKHFQTPMPPERFLSVEGGEQLIRIWAERGGHEMRLRTSEEVARGLWAGRPSGVIRHGRQMDPFPEQSAENQSSQGKHDHAEGCVRVVRPFHPTRLGSIFPFISC
jgi:hypothetical protein